MYHILILRIITHIRLISYGPSRFYSFGEFGTFKIAKDLVGSTLYSERVWSKHLIKMIKTYLPSDGVFIDIGAHMGFFSILASKLSSGMIYAFEPGPCFDLLVQNKRANAAANIIPINAGVGRKSYYCRPSVKMNEMGMARVIECHRNETNSKKMIALDDMNFERVDLIKIDVEGMALDVLTGARIILVQYQPVVIFESFGRFSSFINKIDYKHSQILHLFESIGYTVRQIFEDDYVALPPFITHNHNCRETDKHTYRCDAYVEPRKKEEEIHSRKGST